jgi:hypothetical protein
MGAEAAERDLVGEGHELQGEGEIGVDAGTLEHGPGVHSTTAAVRHAGPMPARSLGRRAAATVALGLAATIVLGACDDDSGDDAQPDRSTRTSSTTTTSQPGVTTTTSSTVPPLTPAPVDSCGDQLEFIVAAIGDAKSTGLIEGDGFTPQRCKLSQSELIWAVVDLVPDPGSSFTETRALMERLGGRWTVHQLGTTNLGCDAPERARVELEITCDDG